MDLSLYKTELIENREVYLNVKAFPGAGKTEVKEIMEDGTVKIGIKAPADKGRANQELVKFLAKELGVNKGSISIIGGWTARQKLVKISKSNKK